MQCLKTRHIKCQFVSLSLIIYALSVEWKLDLSVLCNTHLIHRTYTYTFYYTLESILYATIYMYQIIGGRIYGCCQCMAVRAVQ